MSTEHKADLFFKSRQTLTISVLLALKLLLKIRLNYYHTSYAMWASLSLQAYSNHIAERKCIYF